MSAGRSSRGGLLGGTVCWALHIRLLCCVKSRTATCLCWLPSLMSSSLSLSSCLSLSVSSSRRNVSFLARSSFVLSFFVLFGFIYLHLSLICSSFTFIFPVTSTFLLSVCPVLSVCLFLPLFFLSFLFVFLSSSVLILVLFLCTSYFIVLAHCPLCLLWSCPSLFFLLCHLILLVFFLHRSSVF